MRPVVLGVPCVRRLDLLQELYRSLALGTRPPDTFAIVDNGANVRTVFNEKADASIPFKVHDPSCNLGVSRTWNFLMREYGRDAWLILANDDLKVRDNTIAEMVLAAETTNAEFIYPKTPTQTTFCLFLLKYSAWERVGEFDEGFWPAYYEDIDYWRRLKFANVPMLELESTSYDHFLNGYLKSMDAVENQWFHARMQDNYRRYIRKWGGPPGHETRMEPKELP